MESGVSDETGHEGSQFPPENAQYVLFVRVGGFTRQEVRFRCADPLLKPAKSASEGQLRRLAPFSSVSFRVGLTIMVA